MSEAAVPDAAAGVLSLESGGSCALLRGIRESVLAAIGRLVKIEPGGADSVRDTLG